MRACPSIGEQPGDISSHRAAGEAELGLRHLETKKKAKCDPAASGKKTYTGNRINLGQWLQKRVWRLDGWTSSDAFRGSDAALC